MHMVLSAIQTPHHLARQSKTRTVRAMSDLERQEISTSVDNMEVDMPRPWAGRYSTNKMELEATDPLDWTIDEVVALQSLDAMVECDIRIPSRVSIESIRIGPKKVRFDST
jgi:hypothetical protein